MEVILAAATESESVALLTAANREGFTPLHLLLRAGPGEEAQGAALGALRRLEVRCNGCFGWITDWIVLGCVGYRLGCVGNSLETQTPLCSGLHVDPYIVRSLSKLHSCKLHAPCMACVHILCSDCIVCSAYCSQGAVADPKTGALHTHAAAQDRTRDTPLLLAVGSHMDMVVTYLLAQVGVLLLCLIDRAAR